MQKRYKIRYGNEYSTVTNKTNLASAIDAIIANGYTSMTVESITTTLAVDEPKVNKLQPYKYSEGDRVRIIGDSNSHGYEIGSIVTISMQFAQYPLYNCYEVDSYYLVREHDIELAE